MRQQWKLYSYPSCTSCRDAEKWLAAEHIEVEKTHIYDNPPGMEELRRMVNAHPQGIKAFISTRGRRYRELGLAGREFSDDEWFDLIEKEPRLLRRPIVWNGKDVIVGWNQAEYNTLFQRNDES